MLRQAQVAGQFYPANPAELKRELAGYIDKKAEKVEAIGLICPHAGYIYSGAVAGACFSKARLTKTVLLLGPNHTGSGADFSIMSKGRWQMPLGDIEIDNLLAESILKLSKHLQDDSQAHLLEHSIEVQLPFLQFLSADFRIVPIVLSNAKFAVYREIGRAIAKAIKESKQKVLIVASSDMTHYESREEAQQKDNLALEAILKLDPEELLERIKKFKISMCGFAPVAAMLCAGKELGATRAELVKYQTSGDTSGDTSSVVGYAGVLVA